MAAFPEPKPGAPASAAQRGFRSLFLLYRLHVDSQHRGHRGAQRKTKRSGIAEELNTVTVLAGEGGAGKTWVALTLAAKPRESDDYCGPESDDDLEPGDNPPFPASSRDLPRAPARTCPAHPPAGAGRPGVRR